VFSEPVAVPAPVSRRTAPLVAAAVAAVVALAAVGLLALGRGDSESSSPPPTSIEEDGDGADDPASLPEPDPIPPTAVVTPTTAVVTLPPETTVIATAPPTVATTLPSVVVPEGFPFPNAFEVPQLGLEPVRGTGCGADASIGDLVPDGWWFGGVEDVTSASLRLDLVCVYFGAEASVRIAECAANEDYDVCTAYWGEQFWPVNNTLRYRVVPVAAGLVRAVDSTMGCSLADIDRYEGDQLTWVHIVDGRAVHLQHLCPAG
jgi:hypothetical protein